MSVFPIQPGTIRQTIERTHSAVRKGDIFQNPQSVQPRSLYVLKMRQYIHMCQSKSLHIPHVIRVYCLSRLFRLGIECS